MIYSEPLLSQFNYFFLSLGFGMLLDLWYVTVMLLRMCISEKKWMIVTADLFFSFTASIFSFFFMVIHNNGQVRLNIIAGQFIGAIALHLIIGRRLLSVACIITEKVRQLVSFLLIPFKSFFLIFEKVFEAIKNKRKNKTEKNNNKCDKLIKKFNIIAKMHLKNKNKSV